MRETRAAFLAPSGDPRIFFEQITCPSCGALDRGSTASAWIEIRAGSPALEVSSGQPQVSPPSGEQEPEPTPQRRAQGLR